MRAERLSAYGARPPASAVTPSLARHIEQLGYGALWVGRNPEADLEAVERLLEATDSLVVATGVVNIWRAPVDVLARSVLRLNGRYGERFVLGIGSGHREHDGAAVQRPVTAVRAYLDELEAEGVDLGGVLLAALGPGMLTLAGERTAGAHPYLTTPGHTRSAREILGPAAVLAPEQRVVPDADRQRARAVAGPEIADVYLQLANYRASWRRQGYGDDDLAAGGSDRLLDDLVVSGNPGAVRTGLDAHLDAGADHVAVQVVAVHDDGLLRGYRRVAEALDLSPLP